MSKIEKMETVKKSYDD